MSSNPCVAFEELGSYPRQGRTTWHHQVCSLSRNVGGRGVIMRVESWPLHLTLCEVAMRAYGMQAGTSSSGGAWASPHKARVWPTSYSYVYHKKNSLPDGARRRHA